MNNNALRYVTWTRDDLMRYFGLRKGLRSQYLQQKDFKPGVLSEVQPKQLHETETHDGIIPVKMDGAGYHELDRRVMAMLEIAIPYHVMRTAVQELERVNPTVAATLYAAQHRIRSARWEQVARQLGLVRSALDKRLKSAVDNISDSLDLYLQGLADNRAS